MSLLLLLLPLAIISVISIFAWNKACLEDSSKPTLYTLIKIFSYKNLPFSITLFGLSIVFISIAYRDTCCLGDIDKYLIIFIGTALGLTGSLFITFGLAFKADPNHIKLNDGEQKATFFSSDKHIMWSPRTIFKFSLASIAFSITYLTKLSKKLTFDLLDKIFLLLIISILLTSIIVLIKWFKDYTKETKKAEVLNIFFIIALIVFPYSLFISYYTHVLNVVGCLLFHKFIPQG